MAVRHLVVHQTDHGIEVVVEMSEQRVANVLLVGAGRMGKIRAALLFANPKFNVLGVVDIAEEEAQQIATKYRFGVEGEIATTFKYLDEALENEKVRSKIDGVIISTPTFAHRSLMTVGAKAGLKMFTEKPIEESGDGISETFREVRELNQETGSQSVLCCGFQRRFDKSYVAVNDMIVKGKIGRIVSCNVFFADNPTPPEVSSQKN